jgi:hypothetical protein
LRLIKSESLPSNNLCQSTIVSRFGQSPSDRYQLPDTHEEYLRRRSEAQITHGWNNDAAQLLTTAMLIPNSPTESPPNWRQLDLTFNLHHSGPMEISTNCLIPDITTYCQQQETHTNSTDCSSVSCKIFSILPHVITVEASCTLQSVVTA